jgi:hypothetical protein
MNKKEDIRKEVRNDFKNKYSSWSVQMEDDEIDRRLKEIKEIKS